MVATTTLEEFVAVSPGVSPDTAGDTGAVSLLRRVAARSIDIATLAPVGLLTALEPRILTKLVDPAPLSPLMVGLLTLGGLLAPTAIFALGWLYCAHGWTVGNAAVGIRQSQSIGSSGWRRIVTHLRMLAGGLVGLHAIRLATHQPLSQQMTTRSLSPEVLPAGTLSTEAVHGRVIAPPRPQDRVTTDPSSGTAPNCPQTRLVLRMDDGQVLTPDLPAVVGRRPGLAVKSGETGLMVPDTTHSVSKVHCRISPAAYGLWVEDLGSTNGTLVCLENGRTIRVQPRTPVFAGIGASLRLGKRTMLIGT